jgi:hypothetical protein
MRSVEVDDGQPSKGKSRKGMDPFVIRAMRDIVEIDPYEIGEVVDESGNCTGHDLAILQGDGREGVLKSGGYLDLLRKRWNRDGGSDEVPKLLKRGQVITEGTHATRRVNHPSWGQPSVHDAIRQRADMSEYLDVRWGGVF